jgi:hypothetical protein
MADQFIVDRAPKTPKVNVVTGPGVRGNISAATCDNPGSIDAQWFPLDAELGAGQAHSDVLISLKKPVRNLYLMNAQGAVAFPVGAGRFFIHFLKTGLSAAGGALAITGREPWFDIGYFGRLEFCVPFNEFYWSNQDFGGVERITLLASDDLDFRYPR